MPDILIAADCRKLSTLVENLLQVAGNFLLKLKTCCIVPKTFYNSRKPATMCRKLSIKIENLLRIAENFLL